MWQVSSRENELRFPKKDLVVKYSFMNDFVKKTNEEELPNTSIKMKLPHLACEFPTQCSMYGLKVPPLEVTLGFPDGSDRKESPCFARDPSSIPGLGKSPGEGNGN